MNFDAEYSNAPRVDGTGGERAHVANCAPRACLVRACCQRLNGGRPILRRLQNAAAEDHDNSGFDTENIRIGSARIGCSSVFSINRLHIDQY
jgi:hypothetical protein